MIACNFEGWKREALPAPDCGTVYRFAREGYQVAAVWRARKGWIASGPRVAHAAPFPFREDAMRYCEGF
jgi:hypothetical protein